jgi:hypothetical protein
MIVNGWYNARPVFTAFLHHPHVVHSGGERLGGRPRDGRRPGSSVLAVGRYGGVGESGVGGGRVGVDGEPDQCTEDRAERRAAVCACACRSAGSTSWSAGPYA